VACAQLLRIPELDAAERQQALDVLDRSLRLQQRVLDDLDDLTRLGVGALRVRPARLLVAEVLERAGAAVRHRMAQAEVSLQLHADEVDLAVWADGERLQQVLVNFLTNAEKASVAGQSVTLRARSEGDQVVFEVSDRGRGLSPRDCERVFERFVQIGEGRGLGLGLSIARDLARLQGGRVTVSSDGLGRGATFAVWLPRWRSPDEGD
jgi:signal transduction histidine kinase